MDYLVGEAGLIAAAADRLNLCEDVDLRTIGMELGRSAERLRALTFLGQ